MTDDIRERVLDLIREERLRQIKEYGTNADLSLGFGSSVSDYPWLAPYSEDDAADVETAFRDDYEAFVQDNGNPTWMHLIREEVAELFATDFRDHAIDEAVQVAALCVSLVENMLRLNPHYEKGEQDG